MEKKQILEAEMPKSELKSQKRVASPTGTKGVTQKAAPEKVLTFTQQMKELRSKRAGN